MRSHKEASSQARRCIVGRFLWLSKSCGSLMSRPSTHCDGLYLVGPTRAFNAQLQTAMAHLARESSRKEMEC